MGDRSILVNSRDDRAACPAACPVLPLSEGCLKYQQCQSSWPGSCQPRTSRSMAGAVQPPVSATAAQTEQKGGLGEDTAIYQQLAACSLSLGSLGAGEHATNCRQKEGRKREEESLSPVFIFSNLPSSFETLPTTSNFPLILHYFPVPLTDLMGLQVSWHSGGDVYSSVLHTLRNTSNLEMNQPVHMLLKSSPIVQTCPWGPAGPSLLLAI